MVGLHESLARWYYRGGHPNAVARVLNRASATLHGAGVGPQRWARLEVRGRTTGRTISFPLVVADLDGERYLVSMLGEDVNWVHNVRAAEGRAVLCHGRREIVRLADVPEARRAPILQRHLEVAPGARPHIPVDRRAPLAEFERIAARFPVFRIVPDAA